MKTWKRQNRHLLQRTYLILIFGFMYLPIAVLIAYSFNENKSRAVFTGFSLKWYISLFHNEMILSALGLSLVLALVSSVVATVLGTLATIGINSMSRKMQLVINNISYEDMKKLAEEAVACDTAEEVTELVKKAVA